MVKRHETKSQSQCGPLRPPRHKFHLNVAKRRNFTLAPHFVSSTKTNQLFYPTKNRKYGCARFKIPVAEDLREAEDKASKSGQHATCQFRPRSEVADVDLTFRYALIAGRRIQHGRQYLLESTFAWTAPQITETWVSISRLCDPQILTVCCPTIFSEGQRSDTIGRMAMGSIADHESRWQRVCNQVLPVKRRHRSFEQQGPNNKIYLERSHEV